MAINYSRLGATASRLLRENKRGEVIISRRSFVPAANEWDDPIITWADEVLDAVVTGIDAEMVGSPTGEGGPVFLASDRKVLCATPVEYGANDVIRIDGRDVTVLRVDNILAAGEPLAVKMYVRG